MNLFICKYFKCLYLTTGNKRYSLKISTIFFFYGEQWGLLSVPRQLKFLCEDITVPTTYCDNISLRTDHSNYCLEDTNQNFLTYKTDRKVHLQFSQLTTIKRKFDCRAKLSMMACYYSPKFKCFTYIFTDSENNWEKNELFGKRIQNLLSESSVLYFEHNRKILFNGSSYNLPNSKTIIILL